MATLKRVYRHYEELEEFHAGMWRITHGDVRKGHVKAAADLMRDPDAFKAAMKRATALWPKSTEVAMTAEDTNRIAWLGHAGCCVGVGSPEEATRAGWHTLNASEQDEANRVADEVLQEWLEGYQENVLQLNLFSYMERANA